MAASALPPPVVENLSLAIFPGEPLGFLEGRPAWATLLRPPTPPKLLVESDLLFGASELGWVADGDCRWAPTWAPRMLGTEARPIQMATDLVEPQSAQGKVFLFLSRETRDVVGFGLFGATGEASCRFSPGSIVLSLGAGSQRMEWDIDSMTKERNAVRFHLPPQGVASIPGGEATAGDMVRIGRKQSWIFDADASILGSFIDNDLFRSTLGLQENAGAAEYLATTFLLDGSDLSIRLGEGDYVALFLRNGGVSVCFSEFSITGSGETVVSCDWTRQAERSLRTWIRLNSLAPAPTYFGGRGLPSFLQARSHYFSPPQNGINLASIEEDTILPAAGPQDPEQLCRRVADLSSSFARGVGFREEDLRRGLTPFLTSVALPNLVNVSGDWRSSFSFLGNGAEVRIKGLRSGSINLMEMPAQQKVRASVIIPPGNPTTQGLLLVNGKPVKRFVLNRGALWNPLVHEVEEQVNNREDFEFSVCAWGLSFLPEIMYGFRGILPFVSSRPVCVDVDGDGQCGKQ
jgi:hypothetical protein